MPDSNKVTVLLADEDSLRRDGLASVLAANPELVVVAGCADGQSALDKIRDLRPEVAVIDLNLPGLHGIELVRRVRREFPETKTIILSGTRDDEIVREVVRAGADAYLLKNGPARYLTDAINYVRDGGQYFSPQLHRDGRDRHLREEIPPRPAYNPPSELMTDEAASDRMYRSQDGAWYNERRDSDRPRPRKHPLRRTSDPERFRERIREETSRELRDRDYDIMAQMADGIRPILDRLDEIENRVIEMEEGDEPLPASPRSWLSDQLADTLSGGSRYGGSMRGGGGRGGAELEARLPQMIEEVVTRRFHSMAGQLHEQIEEQHVRTLESFVKNIQVKLLQRVSVLEQNMSHQTEAMLQLREYNQRTEDNLSRLISGVDKLATDLPKRLANAKAEGGEGTGAEASEGRESRDNKEAKDSGAKAGSGSPGKSKRTGPPSAKRLIPKIFWAAAVLATVGGGVYWRQHHHSTTDPASSSATDSTKPDDTSNTTGKPILSGAPTTEAKLVPPPANADAKTKLDAAARYMEKKDYAQAESIFRQVKQSEPRNVDAIKGLASVLYRQDKIEESTAVLDELPKN